MPIASSLASASARSLGFTRRLSLGQVIDNFNRADSATLGRTSDNQADWEVISGGFSINGNRVVPSSGGASSGIAVINMGTADVRVGADVGNGGDAVYFRVLDANNWWRARVSNQLASYTYYVDYWSGSTSCCSSYYIPSNGFGGCTDHSHSHGSQVKVIGAYSESAAYASCFSSISHTHSIVWPTCNLTEQNHSHGHSASCSISKSSQAQTAYYYEYYLTLDKCVAGSITTVSSTTASISSIQVSAQGTTIQVFVNNNLSASLSTVDSHNQGVVKHGIGRGPVGSFTSEAIDNFTCTPL